jgi:cytochrome c-type biogenesis protein CcmF
VSAAGLIGPILVSAAIVFAAAGVVTGRRWTLGVSTLFGFAATALLGFALLTGDFSLAYVAETTSLATPWPYRVAAIWGGMNGSMLFYSTLLVTVGVLAVRDSIAVRVVAAAGLGLLLITRFFANPFEILDIPAVDGSGLLAILQHPAMIYHPPILYLGLVTLVLPFALTVSMALRDANRSLWRTTARRWLYVSWTLLTVGMAAGANWAYAELGWGGYWAWDPVENTALMPWLAATVFLHTSRVEEATGRLARWNVMLAALPFALSVAGVYLTRSGVTGSIHSFAEDPVVGRILLGTAAVVAVLVFVMAVRSTPGARWGRIRPDTDGWLALNAVTLTAILVFISAGSLYPAFSSVFRGEQVTVDPRFFVLTVLPLAIVVAVSVSLALGSEWPLEWMLLLGVTLLVAAVALWIADARVGVLLIAPAAGSTLLLMRGVVRGRARGRMLVTHLAHLGMAVFLVGVAGSSFGDDFSGAMTPGETTVVGGHEVVLDEVTTGEGDRFIYVQARIEVDGTSLTPEIRAYEDQALPVAEPVVRRGVVDDVIVAISLLFPDGETVEVSVFVKPLVSLVWVGAILMALAGLVALFGRAEAVATQRQSAREAQPAAGTTSGTSSP